MHIAIIGSGPSGLYVADSLSRKHADAQIDIFDRLATPYGLVRGGVAPDHQGTKNIVRQYERTLKKANIRFMGNVCIGQDLSYEELKTHYDVVVLTIGAFKDRQLGIQGEELTGVYGSGEIVGWYNGHPDYRDLAPQLGKKIAIVGQGNVALDLARLLAKTPNELADSDMCAHAMTALANTPVSDIYIIGRRGATEASFTAVELDELGKLDNCVPLVDASQLADPASIPADLPAAELQAKQKNLTLLQSFAENNAEDKPVHLHLVFCASPDSVLGESTVEGLRLERTRVEAGRAVATGKFFELDVDTVLTAIGYRSESVEGVPFDTQRGIIDNDAGRVEAGVYTAGWCKRGPQGVIPANRADSLAVAKLILEDLETSPPTGEKTGGQAVDALLAERAVTVISFNDWEKINAAEVAQGQAAGKPREKMVDIQSILNVVNQNNTAEV